MTHQRMDNDALDRLHDFLEERVVPQGGMSLEMLDGFLSALMVGPELVPPAEYLPCIWNEEQVWQSTAEAEEMLGLVMALWNDISRRVCAPLPEEDSDEAEAQRLLDAAAPLLALPADLDLADEAVLAAHAELPLGAAWATGFMIGLNLRGEQWQAWAAEDEEVEEDIDDLAQLAMFESEHAEEAGLGAEDLPTLVERMEMLAELPYVLADLNWKRLERLRPSPARRPDLPGRNDPCVCGSGQKFKKCCGAPGRLN